MKNLNKSTETLLKYHSSYPYRWWHICKHVQF